MELVSHSGGVKETKSIAKYPRKLKKRLKKAGKWPRYVFIWEVENNVTANIDNVIFGK